MATSSAELDGRHSAENKFLLPQHTRPRNILLHSPRKSLRHHAPPFSLADESHSQQQQPPPLLLRRFRLLLTTLITLTAILTLLSLALKFIILPYLLPTPSPTLSILSLSLSHPNSTARATVRVAINNPTWAHTFLFSDSAYTLHFKSKPISEINPNVRIQIQPQRTVEIMYEMLLEETEETKAGLEDVTYHARRRDALEFNVSIYLYGSAAIQPWWFRMVALFYECNGIKVDFSPATDGVGTVANGVACQLVEMLTS